MENKLFRFWQIPESENMGLRRTKMKKAFPVLAVLLPLVLVAACTKGGPAESTAGTTDPITFTFFSSDAPPDLKWDDPIAGKITELTGVTLNIDGPVGGDTQAIPIMIASGKYPDLIFAKGDLGMLIEAGAVLPLDDLIESRGNNIRKLYGDQIVRLRNSPEDPQIYHVGTFGVNNPVWQPEGTLQIQHAVLKDLGYPTISTLADYEKAIKDYMAKYPTINGQKTIGISLNIGSWQWLISLGNPGGYLIGYPDDGQWIVDRDSLEAVYKFLHPDIQIWFKWLNRMYAEGILDPESFTQTEDTWKAKIAAGRVLATSFPKWGYDASRTSLVSDGMEDRTFAYLSVTADERFTDPAMKDYGWGGGWGIAITKDAKDPERAFEFLDWMAGEEAQILTNWGFEGKDHIIVDGIRVIPPEEQLKWNTDPDHSKKTGVGRWAHSFPEWGRGAIDSTGNFITRESPETIVQNYLPVEKETIAAYGAEWWPDFFPPSETLGVSRHGQAWQYTLPPDLNAKLVEADNMVVKTALANMIIGSPSDFDVAWENMVQALRRMGIEDAGKAMTQLIRDRVQFWEKG